MAKLSVVKNKPASAVIGSRVYAFSRETKGCWVYMWADAPEDTPDWAKKWYLLKTDFAAKPGDLLDIKIGT